MTSVVNEGGPGQLIESDMCCKVTSKEGRFALSFGTEDYQEKFVRYTNFKLTHAP